MKDPETLPWLKYDLGRVALDLEGATMAQEGAYHRAMRHGFKVGSMDERTLSRIAREEWPWLRDLMDETPDGGFILPMVQDQRQQASAYRKQRSEAGRNSAKTRQPDAERPFNDHPTTVERPFNDRSMTVKRSSDDHPTVVKRPSFSSSSSSSFSSSLSLKEIEEKTEDPVHEAQVYPTFDDWWEAYGKKVDRSKCESIWNQLAQKVRESIMTHTSAYVKATPDVQYRRNPSTYLNNKNWNDEQLVQRQPSGSGSAGQSREERQRMVLAAVADQHRGGDGGAGGVSG